MKSDEMDEMDDMYEADEASESSESEGMDEGETPESIDEEESAIESAVVDNKVLSPEGGALKEGDEIVLVVVKNYGDSSEVRYKKKSAGKEVQPPGMMAEADAELDAMDQG
jgi:hypothetical protein